MQRAAYRFGVIAAFLLSACLVSGCSSSSDPLDEMGWRYAVTEPIVVKDGETERHQIDPTTNDIATITVIFRSNDTVDYDLFIDEMRLEITRAANSSDAPVIENKIFPMEPESDFIERNGGELRVVVPFFTTQDKDEYIALVGGDIETFSADYRLKIIAYGSYSIGSGDTDVTISESTWFTVVKVPEDTEQEPTP